VRSANQISFITPIRQWFCACAVLLMMLCLPGCARSEGSVKDAGHVRAPELQPNLGWLNTDKPLRLGQELKGHVVLLDFWTYCCINCMHILPDLDYLEKKYADQPFMVVGVHSAKFENEEGRETIAAAVKRYKIHHPVVIDDNMAIWQRYAVQAWPTFILIDSKGYIVGFASGEGNREVLDKAIALTLEKGRENGSLASAPLKIENSATTTSGHALAFPGKVLADAARGRLFIADSNHNRIVVATLPGEDGKARLLGVIGDGGQGRRDGSFEQAQFHNPQGLALRENVLYIADTDNHLVRAADFATSRVTTIAGTGEQGFDRRGGKRGTSQAIASPWALEPGPDGQQLFIAMAGLHQIWSLDLKTSTVQVFSGSGRENIVDGAAGEACFAQPSGLARIGGKLYVADSEVSGVREVDIASGAVQTIVGRGLFIFGDVDGTGDSVRLQHPLGLAAHGRDLILADTYNHKIKEVQPASRKVTTLAGTGKPGREAADGKPAFFEPGGVDVAGDVIYVADTNNHRVVRLDSKTGKWGEVVVEGLDAK